MRRMRGLLLVFALMLVIPCLMPYDGFAHHADQAVESVQVEEPMNTSVSYFRESGVDNSRVWMAFAMAVVAAVPALTYGKQTQFSVNA